MSERKSALSSLLRQQEVLAKFGELALRSDSLDEILTESCRLVAEALGTDSPGDGSSSGRRHLSIVALRFANQVVKDK